MNRSEIRSLVRIWLDEASAGFWSDAELNTLINLSNQRVNSIISALHEDYFTASSTFSTISGTKSYNLPTDFRFMRRLEHYSSTDASDIVKLEEIKFPRIESYAVWPFSASGKPVRYVIRGKQMDLYPVADAVYTMRIYYDVRQDDLSTDTGTTGTPLSPVDFHDMIAVDAAIKALMKNHEPAEELRIMWAERKQELVNTLGSYKGDDPEHVEGYLEGAV